MKTELQNYYKNEIAPVVPEKILDFHNHIWNADNMKEIPWDSGKDGGKYMVLEEYYLPEQLLEDGKKCFPDRSYEAVCFGYPTPAVIWEKDTRYIADAAKQNNSFWPLLVAGPDLGITRERYEQTLHEGGFYGFKVFLNWYGDDYGDKRVEDMFGPEEIALANERKLVILLHVPRSGRLADPVIQSGVQWLAKECPEASIVLAHCGRCYIPSEMKAAVNCLDNLENVYLDTSMVMDPVVIHMALNHIGSERLLFGTDFPVAAMRGRRVRVMDHWVDVVLSGYSQSAYRVMGENFRAGYMAWEIVNAITWGCEIAGIDSLERDKIYYDNGMTLLKRVIR